jgi:hypothetical protein
MFAFRWIVTSYILWAIGASAGAARSALPYAAVVVMADAVLVLRELMIVGLIWLKHDGGVSALELPKIGLNLLFPLTSPLGNAILNEINVFSVWHVLVATIGLHAYAGMSRRLAGASVILAWSAFFGLGIAVSRIGS